MCGRLCSGVVWPCAYLLYLLNFVFAGRIGISPMDLGLMCLSHVRRLP